MDAQSQIDSLAASWQFRCATCSNAFVSVLDSLGRGYNAVPGDFGFTVVRGSDHSDRIAEFAEMTGLDIALLTWVPPLRHGQSRMSWWMSMNDVQRFAAARKHPQLIPVDNWTFHLGNREIAFTAEGPPGVDRAPIPDGAESYSFDIPVWAGYGVTRIQLFIDDDLVCLPGGIEQVCGQGDWRGFAGSDEFNSGSLTDYDLSSRAVIVLDHERGEAVVIAYPTHNMDASETPALPFEEASHPIDESGHANYIFGGGSDDESLVGLEYRLLNSATPGFSRQWHQQSTATSRCGPSRGQRRSRSRDCGPTIQASS